MNFDIVTRSVEKEKEIQYVPVQSSNRNEQSDIGNKKKSKKKQSSRKESENDEISKEPILNKLVKDIRQKVKDSKKFWYNLPYQICNNENVAAATDTDKRCWNGYSIDGYTHPIAIDHTSNPEFSVIYPSSRQKKLVENQLYYLKIAINHLRNAYNGLDVEWSDQDESYYGSGSESGEGIDEEEGSGSSSYDDFQPHYQTHINTPSVRVNIPSGTSMPNVNGTKYTPSDRDGKTMSKVNAASISLRRALIIYLFPVYVAWFGGIISDFL